MFFVFWNRIFSPIEFLWKKNLSKNVVSYFLKTVPLKIFHRNIVHWTTIKSDVRVLPSIAIFVSVEQLCSSLSLHTHFSFSTQREIESKVCDILNFSPKLSLICNPVYTLFRFILFNWGDILRMINQSYVPCFAANQLVA